MQRRMFAKIRQEIKEFDDQLLVDAKSSIAATSCQRPVAATTSSSSWPTTHPTTSSLSRSNPLLTRDNSNRFSDPSRSFSSASSTPASSNQLQNRQANSATTDDSNGKSRKLILTTLSSPILSYVSENMKNPLREALEDKLRPTRLEKSLETSQACASAQALSNATINGFLLPTVPAPGPVKAQKAEITVHRVPPNENLSGNLEKFKFLTYKSHLRSEKLFWVIIWCARSNGDVRGRVAVTILEIKDVLNLYSVQCATNC